MADTSSSTPAAPAAPAAPASRSRLKLFLTIALVVAGAAAGLAWWMSSARQTTDDAQIDGHIVPLAARVQGTVLAVHVKDNQVKAGDVLVELDPATSSSPSAAPRPIWPTPAPRPTRPPPACR